MNLKEYFRLANLFGKLNSQEKLEDDFTTMPEGETLRFFWESCEQEKIDASSIIEITRMKIQKSEKKRKRNYLLITSASIAASILICISTIYFMNLETVVDLDLQAIAEGLDSQTVDEVTLITAKEQLIFDEDALREIAKEAMTRKTGARGLRAIIEKTIMEQMYEIPSDDTVVSCRITKDMVDGVAGPIIERSDEPRTKKNASRKRKKQEDTIA